MALNIVSPIRRITPQGNNTYKLYDKFENELTHLSKVALTTLMENFESALNNDTEESVTVTEYGRSTNITFTITTGTRPGGRFRTFVCCRNDDVIGAVNAAAMFWLVKIVLHCEENRPQEITVSDSGTTTNMRIDERENKFWIMDQTHGKQVTVPLIVIAYLRSYFEDVKDDLQLVTGAIVLPQTYYSDGGITIQRRRHYLIFDDSLQNVAICERSFRSMLKFATGENSLPDE